MSKVLNITKIQDEIYRKMSSRKKLNVLNMFYKTARILNKSGENERKYSNRYPNIGC